VCVCVCVREREIEVLNVEERTFQNAAKVLRNKINTTKKSVNLCCVLHNNSGAFVSLSLIV
jgi:hypothetical protein